MQKKEAATKPIKEETNFADEVIHSLNDFFSVVDRGDTITVRKMKLDLQPSEYKAQDVRRTRKRLALSQAMFAKLLAVKVKTVQSWQQGERPPAGTARRLLDDMNQNPQRWLDFLKHAVTSQTTQRAG